MINSEVNTIELGTNVAGATMFHKQPILAPKKVALRDVQNNNSNLTRDPHQESLIPTDGGHSFLDASKTSGTKRLTPDYSSPLLNTNGAHEPLTYPRRKYEYGRNVGSSEKIAGYQQSVNGKNMHYGTLVTQSQMGSKTSVARFKESSEDQRTDRFIRLQNFIKQCDGSNHGENIQFLLRLSPSELSRHAVELEKRAIQLTIDEGKEMQRMQTLNILGKSSATRNQMPIAQPIQHKN